MNSVLFDIETLNKELFLNSMDEYGYAILKGVIMKNTVLQLKKELADAIAKESAFHGTMEYKEYGMLLACPLYGGAFLDILDNQNLLAPFNWILGDNCIIYAYTSSSMQVDKGNFSSRIHVDRSYFIPGYTDALGCLILLDDFTEENGATWVLPGSHKNEEQPDEDFFYKNAVRVIAPAGSVFYFHLRLWHAGGINKSDKLREALGIGFIKPYLKQRIDLPRAMSKMNIADLTDGVLQKLGFFAQIPDSLENFYKNATKHNYMQ